MPKIMITYEYLRLRLVSTLLIVAAAIGIAYVVTISAFDKVIAKVEAVVVFGEVVTIMSESFILLDDIRHQEHISSVEPVRVKLRQSAQMLEITIAEIKEMRASGAMSEEVENLIENPVLDPIGLLEEFLFISMTLAKSDAPTGRLSSRWVNTAQIITDQILPTVRRLNQLEVEDLQSTNATMRGWIKILVVIMLIMLVGIGKFVFRPMESAILGSQKEIREKQTQAEAATVAKSDFLSSMSHEIRTPMNGVLGMAEVLQNTQLQPDQHQMVDVIRDSGRDLMVIIEDILDFSKIEANKLVLEQEKFHLRTVLDHLQLLLGPMAEKKGVTYRHEISDQLEDAHYGDKGRVQQILTNLIGNAIKFTDSGSIKVEIDADPIFKGAQNITMRVTDSGIGIEDKHLEQIFLQFEQADNSSIRRFGGTGLGLAISSRLADAMGGSITVNSEFGHGATFVFSVSLRSQAPKKPKEQALYDTEEAIKIYRSEAGSQIV